MSKYFKFNDEKTHIVRVDDFNYSYVYRSSSCYSLSETYTLKIIFKQDCGEELCLDYNNKETADKDVVRLARFLNKKENKNE